MITIPENLQDVLLAHEKRLSTKGKFMKKEVSNQLTTKQRAEINKLAAMSDEQINTQDIPEETNWNNARRGVFFRPVKQQITLRLDADLIAWFKENIPTGKGYQTSINNALREYIGKHQ